MLSLFLLIPPFCGKGYGATRGQTYKCVYISGHYDAGVKHGDSIKISFWKDPITVTKSIYTPHRSFTGMIRNGNFRVRIDSVDDVGYVSISDVNDKWGHAFPFLKLYLVQPGDDVYLRIYNRPETKPVNFATDRGDSVCTNCTGIIFSGKGADKFSARYRLDSAITSSAAISTKESTRQEYARIREYEQKGLKPPVQTLSEKSRELRRTANCLEKTALETLAPYRLKTDREIYQIMKANLIGEIEDRYYLKGMLSNSRYSSATGWQGYKKLFRLLYAKTANSITDAIALKSVYYLDFLLDKSQLANDLYQFSPSGKGATVFKIPSHTPASYYFIKLSYRGLLREKLQLSYLINYSQFFSDPSSVIQDGLNTIKTKEYMDVLSEMTLSAQVGKKAYNFSLPDSTDRNITLDSYKGKVVFIDFWFSGCNGCAEYYRTILSKVEQDYKNNDRVVFISISADANKSTWEKAVHSQLYTSPEAVNLYKATSSPVIRQFSVMAYPHPLLIDKNGMIFSDSEIELRGHGVSGLENKINQALTTK